MTKEEFGAAYQSNFCLTVRFLMARGLTADEAQETAQAAWACGWERLSKLEDSRPLLVRLNRVALSIHRSLLRKELAVHEVAQVATAPRLNVAAIDAARILERCKLHERRVLRDYYLNGMHLSEIARRNGWRENTARVRLFRARQAARFRAQPSTNAATKATTTVRRPAQAIASRRLRTARVAPPPALR